jgi:hypothetical protein
MMKSTFVLTSLLSLLVIGCDGNNNQTTSAAAAQAQTGVISEKSVWQGNLDKCRNSESVENCFINEIKSTGNEEALKAAQFLAQKGDMGYISAYHREGTVGVASVEYPFRANTNSSTLLIPSEGQPVDVDDIDEVLEAFPAWREFAKQHPDAAAWPPATLVQKDQTDNGLNYIYSYPVQNCHACDRIAILSISYQFTPEGKFIKSEVTEIK